MGNQVLDSHFLKLVATGFLASGAAVFAQPKPEGCVVGEFKAIALRGNTPDLKNEQIKQWLVSKGNGCNKVQKQIIMSNAPSWLGTAFSVEISGMIEGLYESEISKDESRMAEMYLSKGKSFKPGMEVTKNPEPRPPVVQQPAAPVVAGNVANIVNENTLVVQEKELPKKEEPAPRFSQRDKMQVRKYFDELRGGKECPPFMKPGPDNLVCKSVRDFNRPYKLDLPYEQSPFINELPDPLRVMLSSPPRGFKYLHANEDIIMVNSETRVVVDAVIDYYGVPVLKSKKADAEPPAKK